jgi:isoleucyl-tRNA synthetase
MALARRLSSLGRSARSEAGVKVRQPLARALVYLPPGSPIPPPGIVEEELNVDAVEVTDELGDVLAYELIPNYRLLGPRLGPRVQAVKAAIRTVDSAAAAADLNAGRPLVLELDDGPVELVGDEVELRRRAQAGFAVSGDGSEVVALDLALDEDLRLRGLAREVIRNVQELRKDAGLEVSDWIHLTLVGLDGLEPLFDAIAREVLARSITTTAPVGGDGSEAGGGSGGTTVVLDDAGSVREATVWLVKA